MSFFNNTGKITNSLWDKLKSQVSNQENFPNILQAEYQSLQRELQKIYDTNFGLKIDGNNYYFLVLSVHGKKIEPDKINQNSNTNKNAIFLANYFWNFDSGTKLILNTNNNRNVPVTITSCLGNGAFQVAEDLVLDIRNISSEAQASKPYLLFVKG
jgi:hypothetical protein